MDEMDTLNWMGWEFLCSGEQLPAGQYHAAVRYKAPPSGQLRTLILDPEKFGSARQAVGRAKELAKQWAADREGDGQGNS